MGNKNLIINIISETLGVEREEIIPEADFYTDLNADKVEVMDIILKVRETCKADIDENDLAKIKTVADLYNVVEEVSDDF
jgi:acyl carrier protein